MYEQFYGLHEKPFNVTPDPRFLYLSKHHQEALAHLMYGITERKGFIVITGEVGTGKTTLLRSLLDRLDTRVKTALIFNPSLSLEDFFLLVSDEFELEPEGRSKGQFLLALNQFLLDCSSHGEIAVLIIDEAQNLSPELMEEIRMLLNLETASEKLLQIVLSGQPELLEKLNLPELRQLKQRISLRYDVHPLTKPEAAEYIHERLRKAGAKNSSLFTAEAVETIYEYSRGIPRLINILCDSSLLTGYADEQERIEAAIVRESIADLEGTEPSNRFQVGRSLRREMAASSNWRRAFIGVLLLLILILGVWVIRLEYPALWESLVLRGRNALSTCGLNVSAENPARDPGDSRALMVEAAQPQDLMLPAESADTQEEEGNTMPVIATSVPPAPESAPAPDSGPPADRQRGTASVAASGRPEETEEAVVALSDINAASDSLVPSGGRIISVGRNDSLSKISMRWYGMMTGDIIRKIKEANPQIVDINYIEEGWQLVLPGLNTSSAPEQLYSVHVASFKKFEDAYALFFRLVQEGKEAYLVPVSISGRGSWYRVTVGGFSTKADADAFADDVIASHGSDYAEPIPISESAAMAHERQGEERIHE